MDNIPDISDKLNIAGSPVDPNEITVTADLSNLDVVTDFIDERLAANSMMITRLPMPSIPFSMAAIQPKKSKSP